MFSVQLATQPTGNVTVSVTSGDTDAATVFPASYTFSDSTWNMDQTFTVTGVNDADADNETVTISLTASGADYADVTGSVTVNVTDDDRPTSLTVNFGAATYSVAESDDPSTTDVTENQVTVTVTLSDDPRQMVTIPITRMDQDGASSDDYSGVPDDVVFSSGDTEKTFTFTATDDTEDDDDESVKLTFGTLPTDPVVVTAVSPDETVISIADDDPPTSLTVNFERGTYTVAEGSSVMVTITLNDDPEQTVVIPLMRVTQGGASDTDYSGVPDRMTFNSGDTQQSFTFTATQDTENDDGESVEITFGTLPDTPVTVTAGTTGETVISITDDDRPTSLTVNFGAATYSVAESDDPSTTDVTENQVTVTVTLSDDPERTVTIPITRMDQDGASSGDYSGVPDDVVFSSGDTEKTFTFTATDDTEDDDDESVKLTFGTLPSDPVVVTAVSPDETVISITDDDTGPSLVINPTSLPLDEVGTAMFSVQLATQPTGNVTVSVTSGDTDAATVFPASYTFSDSTWNMDQTFTVTGVNDADADNETVTISLTASGADYADVTGSVTVNVTDDDRPTSLTVNFGAATYSVAESDDPSTTDVTENQVQATTPGRW